MLIDSEKTKQEITTDCFLDILLAQNGKSEIKKLLIDMIDSLPLAYDIEKVVNELERNKDSCATIHGLQVCVTLEKAVKIVRQTD